MDKAWTLDPISELPRKGEGPEWPRPTGAVAVGTLTSRLELALIYALRAHALQSRKREEGSTATPIPYLGHLLGVVSLVIDHGGDEDMAIAAVLHDVVEDQGGDKRLAEILDIFGERATVIVEACTDRREGEDIPYRARKERYIEHLSEVTEHAALVSCADKLHNARAILADYRELGDKVFERFNAFKSDVLWYYEALVEAFGALRWSTLLAGRLSEELARVVGELLCLAVPGAESRQ